MDWFKRLVSKDPPASAKSDSHSSADSSPTTSSSPSPSPNKPVPLTKEDLKRQAEAQKAKEKELLGQLNLAWKHLEDCNPKDRPAKHAALMHMFLTLYDEHKFSFKTIRTGFPGLTSGFQTAVCTFLKDGFLNVMNHGTPNQSPKKRRNTQKIDKATAQAAASGDLGSAQSLRLYTFLDKEAYDTLRVLLILSQELVEVNPLVAADMPTVLVNIFQRFWQLPEGIILSPSERNAKSTPSSISGATSSHTTRSPSPPPANAPAPSLRPSPEELLISVLLQLCSSKVSIQKLTESDAFARLFIMPLMHCDGNASLRDRILPVTSTIIKYHIDRAVIDYMMRRESVMSIVEVMANNFENFTPSNILDSCTMILTLLEESVKVSPDLINEFNNRQGYNLLTKALVVLEDQAPGSYHHTQLIEYIKEFVFVGPEPLYPEYDDENPYNPPPVKRDPVTGKVIDDPNASITVSEDGTKLRRARNAEAFQVMQNCFFGSKHDKTKEMILDGMVALFSAHPGNFYALQHLRTLAHFVEALPMESAAVRDGIHQLVLCCATYINVVPYYALVSLWNVFAEAVPNAKMSVIEGVFNTFLVLLNYDPMYRTILTRAGILDGLIELLQRYHKTVAKMLMNSSKLNAKGPSTARRGALKRAKESSMTGGSSSDFGSMLGEPKRGAGSGSISLRKFGARGALARLKMERMREQTRVCEELLADKSIESLDINKAFPAVTDLLSLMVTEHPENASKLKKANGSQALHNLMQQTETRSGALTILVQLIKHDESQTEGDMGNLLITLSSHSDIELRRDILLALLDLFKATPATKRSFREFGGFASVMTTVVLLKTRLDVITLKNDEGGYNYYLDTLQLTLCVLTAALSNHRVNRLHMAAHGGWPLLETSIKETGLWESNPEMYIDFLFQLATEDIQYVQTIPSSASTFAKSKLAKDAATLLSDNGALLEAQQKAYKKRTGRYTKAVSNYIDFYTSQNLTSTGEVVAEPKDLLSILLAMDSGEHVDQPADFKSTWTHILPIIDRQSIIFNPGPLSAILNLIPPIPVAVPSPLRDLKEQEDETENSENETSSNPSPAAVPPKPASVSPQQVIWHLHILLRLTDFARANVGNLEAFSSLGLAGKVMRKWSSHIRNLGSPLNPLLLYLVELEMAYRPDTLEVNQYLGLFEPSAISSRSLQALLQSLHRSAVSGLARLPPFFLFDLSRHGYGSMSTTLSDVQWPCSDGYTISLWCYFDRFSPDDLELIRLAPQAASNFHPTFSSTPSANPSSLVPPANQCMLSIVLRTGQLIFRTAGAEEPLTVETFNFATGRWYHVAIVHERSKFGFSNNVDTKVYIDGVVRGSIKANMGTPVNNSTLNLTLGTPEELHKSRIDNSFHHGVSSAWRLGPFTLLDQALQNVDILTIFNLGPCYYASFQGSLSGHFAPDVINSQYLLALEDIRGEPIAEADESKLFLQSGFNVDRVMVNINAVKHVLQMHPSSRNLPNFAFLRDPTGKRGIAPLFATTSDAIRGTSAVVTTPQSNSDSSESDAAPSLKTSRRASVDLEKLAAITGAAVQKEVGDGDVSEGNKTALVNAAGVLAGLGSPIEGPAGPAAVAGTSKSADNTRPPLTLHFEMGDSPIACWPQPLQTVLYRSNGIDMLTYLFEFVASCEVSTVQSTFLSTSVPSSSVASASMASLPSENDDSSMHTPPSSARQSSQLGSATPSTPTLPHDTSMALLVLRCIRAILRSNPQSYSEVLEKNVYNAIAQVLKRFPQQLTEEKLKLFFDLVGVVPNGFTSSNASAAQEEAMTQFLTNYDSSVLNSIPKPISESLWSLALHRIPPGSLATSTVSNVMAFKVFFMDYRLWRKAPLRLQEMHLDYIDLLIQDNLLFQFNVGRLRKAHLLAYLLNVLREDSLDMTLFIRVVGLISDLLVAHHTEKDMTNVAGFLIHSFHLQNNPPTGAAAAQVDANELNNRMEQLAVRFDILRNMLMSVVYYLVADAEHKSFYESVFDPDWLNLFITQETNPDTVTIAFKILAQLYYGSSAYSLKVDKTNILKNLSTVLPVFHSHAPLYFYLFGMTFGKPPTELPDQLNTLDFSALSEVFKLLQAEEEYHIVCRGSLDVIFAMIKASSEAFIELNDAHFVALHSPSSPAINALDIDSSSAGLGATSSYDNLGSVSSRQSDQSSEEESPRRHSVEAMLKSSSTTALNTHTGMNAGGSASSLQSSAAHESLTSRRSADVSELSRRRATSLALPRGGASSSHSAGGTNEDTISEEQEQSTDDSSATGPGGISIAAGASGLTNLVNRGGIAAATMSGALLGVFKGSKSSKRKSMVINQYVPQQVIGGTMSGALVTNRVYPKFQDKFRLYSPPVHYQEQSENLSANFAPHRMLIQFLKHVFARSSSMQDLIRKGDLAHHIISILFPLGKLNIPHSGATWNSPLSNAGHAQLTSSASPVSTVQSGADQWSLLIMEFLAQILINQAILNPTGSRDNALLHEIFEIAPPQFSAHSDLLRFNSIMLHYLFDQVRAKLTFVLASTAHNALAKLLAPLSRFCAFSIDRIACCWTQAGFASLTLTFICDVITTIQDKMEEEQRKGSLSSKDLNAIKAELTSFTKSLNRLVLHMIHEPLREKTQNQISAAKLAAMSKVMAQKRLWLSPANNDKDFFGTLCKALHTLLMDSDAEVRNGSISLWRLVLSAKMDQVEFGLTWKNQKGETIDLRSGFMHLVQPGDGGLDSSSSNSTFIKWFKESSLVINTIFEDHFGKVSRNYWTNELKVLEERKALSKKHNKTRDGRTNKSLEVERITRKRILTDNTRLQQRILAAEMAKYQQTKHDVIDLERYYQRKWSQRRVTLFHDLHIWSPVPQDPDTDSPLHPGLAPIPHHLHKWALDLTEGPNRMRSKTRRNDDFYSHYPFDPTNLQATSSGPIIYPTRTPQSTSAKLFAALSEDERILVDLNYYVQRSLRRHQLLAAAQTRSLHAVTAGHEVDVDEDTESEEAASSLTGSLVVSREVASGNVSDEDDLEGLNPEQAALERLNRLGKMIPASQRHSVAADADDEESLTSSGRRARAASLISGKSSSRISVSEGKPAQNKKAGGVSGESDDDTGNDLNSQIEDEPSTDAGGTSKRSTANQPEEVTSMAQLAEEADAEDEGGDQKLKRLLQPGDEPTDMYNCGRVVGLDKMDGIFVVCQNNAYFIQDYHITQDHELVEVTSTSGGVGHHSAHHGASGLDAENKRRVLRWAHVDLEQVLRRRYLLRPVAIEIFSVDGRNSLLVFDLADRERVISVMGVKQQAVANRLSQSTGVATSAKSLKLSLKESTDMWSSGQITNFEYLMRLNTIAGRSYNDLTQYPVFPWIVADYTSPTLDLSNLNSFRDLTKPMGALGEERRQRLLERYEMLDDAVPRFHYGSHYSSAAIVLHYLIRLEPMTQQFLTLQGGRFDRPDRLFESVGDSWIAASTENPMDVKELVPEFYYLPEAFLNRNNFIFGRKQTGDEAFIDDVILPPWANGDAHTFVRLNRQALESPYVSENLHHWIDLIFGFKQQGSAAEAAMNLFYYLTYEGAVDIDKITDAVEKQGIIDQINNFGQTPTQLFKKPHPKRQLHPKLVPSLFGTASSLSSGFTGVTGAIGATSASAASTASSSGTAAISAQTPSVTVSAASSGSETASSSSSSATTSSTGSTSTASSSSSSTTGGVLHSSQSGDSSPSTTSSKTSDKPNSMNLKISITKSMTGGSEGSAPVSPNSSEPPTPTGAPKEFGAALPTSRMVIQCSAMVNKGVAPGLAIGQVVTNSSDKVVALEMMKVALPGHLSRRIAWGYDDMALRFWDNDKLVLVVPNVFHRSGIISCVSISSDGKYVVTGGTDAVLCVFRLDWEGKRPIFQLASTGAVSSKLTGHCAPIAHVTVSRAFSMIVSADTMGQVLIWDLNTFQFTRTLCGPLLRPSPASESGSSAPSTELSSSGPVGPGTPRSVSKRMQIYHEHQYSVDGDIRAAMAEASVESGLAQKSSSHHTIDLIQIDEACGNIYTSAQGTFCIWDINGELLACEEVSKTSSVSAFISTTLPEWMDGVNFLVLGFKDGAIRIYRQDTRPRLENVAMINGKWPILPPGNLVLHTQFADKHKAPVTALCLSPNQKKLYSGDSNGVLFKWEEVKVD
jgi:hypothetical protein